MHRFAERHVNRRGAIGFADRDVADGQFGRVVVDDVELGRWVGGDRHVGGVKRRRVGGTGGRDDEPGDRRDHRLGSLDHHVVVDVDRGDFGLVPGSEHDVGQRAVLIVVVAHTDLAVRCRALREQRVAHAVGQRHRDLVLRRIGQRDDEDAVDDRLIGQIAVVAFLGIGDVGDRDFRGVVVDDRRGQRRRRRRSHLGRTADGATGIADRNLEGFVGFDEVGQMHLRTIALGEPVVFERVQVNGQRRRDGRAVAVVGHRRAVEFEGVRIAGHRAGRHVVGVDRVGDGRHQRTRFVLRLVGVFVQIVQRRRTQQVQGDVDRGRFAGLHRGGTGGTASTAVKRQRVNRHVALVDGRRCLGDGEGRRIVVLDCGDDRVVGGRQLHISPGRAAGIGQHNFKIFVALDQVVVDRRNVDVQRRERGRSVAGDGQRHHAVEGDLGSPGDGGVDRGDEVVGIGGERIDVHQHDVDRRGFAGLQDERPGARSAAVQLDRVSRRGALDHVHIAGDAKGHQVVVDDRGRHVIGRHVKLHVDAGGGADVGKCHVEVFRTFDQRIVDSAQIDRQRHERTSVAGNGQRHHAVKGDIGSRGCRRTDGGQEVVVVGRIGVHVGQRDVDRDDLTRLQRERTGTHAAADQIDVVGRRVTLIDARGAGDAEGHQIVVDDGRRDGAVAAVKLDIGTGAAAGIRQHQREVLGALGQRIFDRVQVQH